jgi:DNA-binding GntR family transcriptional regulator
VEAAENKVLLDLWKTLRVEARVVVTALKTDIDLDELAEMHRPLLEALAEGRPRRPAGRSGTISRSCRRWSKEGRTHEQAR